MIVFETNNSIYKDVIQNLNLFLVNINTHKDSFTNALSNFFVKHLSHNSDYKIKCTSIEGTIGAGKTTFLKHFTPPGSVIIKEPVDIWINEIFVTIDESKMNLLDSLYKFPENLIIIFGFQFLALVTKYYCLVSTKIDKDDKNLVYIDRSIKTDLVFKDVLCTNLQLDKHDHFKDLNETCMVAYQICEKLLNSKFDFYFIFLDVSPEVALTRIKKRGRIEEKNLSSSYVGQLNDGMKSYFTPLHSVFLDWNSNQNVL